MHRKYRFFGLCSKMALTILMKFTVEVVLISIFQPAKTVCPKKFWFWIFLRSNLDRSVGVMIPWANKSQDMCYILLICHNMKMKLKVKATVKVCAKIKAIVKAKAKVKAQIKSKGQAMV